MSFDLTPGALLPSEPRVPDRAGMSVLTERHLLPALPGLQALFLGIRARLDPGLRAARPVKLGKPYPLGQCLEISLAVQQQVKGLDPRSLTPSAAAGHAALAAFFRAGGTMRRVWGDLRGQYFQNAFLAGTLYIDVANDTVVPTKPKVEILPFDQARLHPIADYRHYARIAERYWQATVWPNHVVPELAPYCPLITVSPAGVASLRDVGDYMMALTLSQGFAPSRAVLAGDPLPIEVFERLAAALAGSSLTLAAGPEAGRAEALGHCAAYRTKRWHRQPTILQRMLHLADKANRDLAQAGANEAACAANAAPGCSRRLHILFIHRHFPDRFAFLAPALARRGHNVVALTMRPAEATRWQGVTIVPYGAARGTTPGVHPWVGDFEAETIRGEACFRAALGLRERGFAPDVIVSSPGWGESLFLKEVWPRAKLGICCEFHHRPPGAMAAFDPEFPPADVGEACRLRLKNLGNLLHCETADAGLSPTRWQAAMFPEPFRSRITVVHDGIDTDTVAPDPGVSLTLNGHLVLTRQDEVVTFASRNLEPCRGYHVFMRALPEILARRPHARVLIAGGDEAGYGPRPDAARYGATTWKEVFAREVRPQIPDADWARVHFLGVVPRPFFVPLLQLSTVHAYLTYPLVLSASLLEAMSAGCAIVASDTPPLREAVRHDETGRLVGFFDVAGLAGAVCALLGDPAARQRLGENARRFAQAHYDLRTRCLPGQVAWVEGLAGDSTFGPDAWA
uniref:Glycosyltransferase n=1 Tax=Desulfovibrio sp. U5L TaxID=596152 RepID=I2Q2J9_9BACT